MRRPPHQRSRAAQQSLERSDSARTVLIALAANVIGAAVKLVSGWVSGVDCAARGVGAGERECSEVMARGLDASLLGLAGPLDRNRCGPCAEVLQPR